MENFNQANIEFDYTKNSGMNKEKLKSLEKYLTKLNNCFKKDNENFADLCFYVYQVRSLFIGEYCYNKKGQMLQFYSIMEHFGLSETDTSRLCNCYNKFFKTLVDEKGNCINYYIKPCFFGFSKSKLFELLSVPTEILESDIKNKILRTDMSVKTIRDYVKNYKNKEKADKKLEDAKEEKQEIIEEDIPMAYDPKKHYDFDYFEDKTKAQLLNIVWQLQTEYEKLKKELKKK